MLSIRFSRTGKKKQPYYRVIVTEKTRDPWGKFLEILGQYNPRSKDVQIKADRVNYWLQNGAQPSPSVHNLLVSQGIIKEEKVRASKSKPGKKRKAELDAQAKAEAAKAAEAKAAAEAKEEPAAEATPETPIESAE